MAVRQGGRIKLDVVLCRDCARRGDPIECPMCEEIIHDDDGYSEYYTNDCTSDLGFCHCGITRKEYEKLYCDSLTHSPQ